MGSEEVLIAVDPHKGHNTLVVLDALSRRAVEEAEFANTHAGYWEMVRFEPPWVRWRLGLSDSQPVTGGLVGHNSLGLDRGKIECGNPRLGRVGRAGSGWLSRPAVPLRL